MHTSVLICRNTSRCVCVAHFVACIQHKKMDNVCDCTTPFKLLDEAKEYCQVNASTLLTFFFDRNTNILRIQEGNCYSLLPRLSVFRP